MDTAEGSFCSLPGVPFSVLGHPAEGDLMHTCIRCGIELVAGENIIKDMFDKGEYVCSECLHFYYLEYHREYERMHLHQSGKCQPMGENKACAQYLGVHVAEQVLSKVFKDVKKMPYGNPGYDFICGGGHKIDVKSSCRRHPKKNVDHWMFIFNKNKIAEYFLCLAFDNRQDLNPEHIWLIPAGDVNDKTGMTISETRLKKWNRYEQSIDKVISCCDAMKGR